MALTVSEAIAQADELAKQADWLARYAMDLLEDPCQAGLRPELRLACCAQTSAMVHFRALVALQGLNGGG